MSYEINKRKIIHIVHAPTNRICKGSDYVLKALSKLKNIYGDIVKISLVENLSHVEALKIYSEADLIIGFIIICSSKVSSSFLLAITKILFNTPS